MTFGIPDHGAFGSTILLFLALMGTGTYTRLTSESRHRMPAGAAAAPGLIAGDQVLLWLPVAGAAAAFLVNFGIRLGAP